VLSVCEAGISLQMPYGSASQLSLVSGFILMAVVFGGSKQVLEKP
jgi:hypothetical protein